MTLRLALMITTALMCTGCFDPSDWGPNELGAGKTSQAGRTLELGRTTYATYCVGCHGEKGDGAGPAARFLDPKPRDFRKSRIKFASVESGQRPLDEDYLRVITEGLAGTAMPAFPLLTAREREALVAYVKTFRSDTRSPGERVAFPKDPFADDPAKGIAAGQKVYHMFVKCWACHPTYATKSELTRWASESSGQPPALRPDPYHSMITDSDWGTKIRAPDFLQDRIKTGVSLDGLVRVIGTGVGGTAMPTWWSALKPDQLWGLAYYVRDLNLKRGSAATTLRDRLAKDPMPASAKAADTNKDEE